MRRPSRRDRDKVTSCPSARSEQGGWHCVLDFAFGRFPCSRGSIDTVHILQTYSII